MKAAWFGNCVCCILFDIFESEAKSLVENYGGKVLGSISKKLDILVIGDSKPTKKKIESAKQLNIRTIKENDWYKLLDLWASLL